MSKNVKVAIFCPVHKDARFIASQLDNYYAFHEDDAAHFLHFSRASGITLEDVQNCLETNVRVDSSSHRWGTSYRGVFGAFLAITRYVHNKVDEEFSHVYLHSDGDLLVRGNLIQTIQRVNCAYTKCALYGQDRWPHYSACMSDQRVGKMRSDLGISNSELFFGRQEGSFFPTDLWQRMMAICEQYLDETCFDDESKIWPMEEVLIPTLASKLSGGQQRPGRPVVRTKEIKNYSFGVEESRHKKENVVQVSDVQDLLNSKPSSGCIGMKWFSRDLSDPARMLVSEMIGPAKS